ncbi:hypothetical protein [Chitinophaga sp. Cy-1792]|uniref:hypothetical protein n=1 Tax=Chitinophaga sp. Cy-1792 TaxID=2608339 RepID=UPI00141DFEF4|nr:hypothetical protein [Chitinophaga sp. Cy-1792]NIG54498.1 hypothetical protein [Chitinophaga sp. Cy-1792]
MNRYLRVIIFLLLAATAQAQEKPLHYTWEARLPKVDSSGFYHISPSPALLGQLNYPDLSNFRIVNDSTTVPYLAKQQQLAYDATSFIPLEIVSSTREGRRTVLIIHNKDSVQLDQLIFLYKNTNVEKQIRIDGSDDKAHWYAVQGTYMMDPGAGLPTSDPTVSAIGKMLPLLSYRWLSVVIDDSLSSPLMIKSIGYYRQQVAAPAGFVRLPAVHFLQTTNSKVRTTQVVIHLPECSLVGKLAIAIKSPALYHRRMALQEKIVGDKKDAPATMRTLASFYLSSDQPNSIILKEPVKTKELYLQIDNEDNPPLVIDEIAVWQPDVWLTVYLEKGRQYYIKGAPEGIPPGQYDLDYFSKDIPRHLPVIVDDHFNTLAAQVAVPVAEKSFFNSAWWIWAGIIVIVVLLFFVARGVLKDMKQLRPEK